MKKRYETIVFDLGNTLIGFDHMISARKFTNLFRLDSKKVYSLFFDSAITRLFERGLIAPKEFHRLVVQELGIHLPYHDFTAIWNDIFWEDKGSCSLARELKESYGYRLFLLSNINRLHFEYIRKKFDIISIFDEVILSFMVGAIKPDKLIFDDMVRRAGGDRAKVVYIDDREDLITEAGRLGIDAIRYAGSEALAGALRERGII